MVIMGVNEQQGASAEMSADAFFFLFLLWAGLRDPIECALLDGGIPSQNSGYKSTRLCPSLCLGVCYYIIVPLP